MTVEGSAICTPFENCYRYRGTTVIIVIYRGFSITAVMETETLSHIHTTYTRHKWYS